MIYGINPAVCPNPISPDRTGENNKTPIEQISDFKNVLWQKIIHGETEEKFRIGANEMSVKEWDKLIARMDHTIDEIKEGIREQNEQDMEDAARRAELEKIREKTCFFNECTI